MTRGAAVALLALLLAGACGGGDDEPVRVLAAASLTEAFQDMEPRFEDEHDDIDVELVFGASSALAEQIAQDAPADVFASADEETMARVVDAGDAADLVVIARNRLALLVESGNPKEITGLADLDGDDVVFATCAPEVPCGRLAAAALREADVSADPASLEENVKAVVAKVTLGEVDAGIVYATDAVAVAGDADVVAIDEALDPELETSYPIAILDGTDHVGAAAEWIAFVRSDDGQTVLRRHGFLDP